LSSERPIFILPTVPRVSDDHLEARRTQILDAARRLFSEQGFHRTSMQDILRESGLSAGAVYRYFPAKEDMVVAISREAMATIRAAFERDPDEDLPPLQLLEGVLAAVDAHADRNGVGRLALQVWAEAGRSPAIRERLAESILEARSAVAARLRRQYGAVVDADALAAALVALLPGYLHARVMVGDVTPAGFCRSLEALAVAYPPPTTPGSPARGSTAAGAQAA